MNPEMTSRDVLIQLRQEYAREYFKEVSKYNWNHLTYNLIKETFAQNLETLKKTAKQAFGDKASDGVKRFLLRKLRTQFQHELYTTEKSDPSVEDIKVIIQRRFQYQQLIPQQTSKISFNEITSRNNRPPQCTRTPLHLTTVSNSTETIIAVGTKNTRLTYQKTWRGQQTTARESRRTATPKNNWEMLCNSLVTHHEIADTERKAHLIPT